MRVEYRVQSNGCRGPRNMKAIPVLLVLATLLGCVAAERSEPTGPPAQVTVHVDIYDVAGGTVLGTLVPDSMVTAGAAFFSRRCKPKPCGYLLFHSWTIFPSLFIRNVFVENSGENIVYPSNGSPLLKDWSIFEESFIDSSLPILNSVLLNKIPIIRSDIILLFIFIHITIYI